ncbi:hypothetical protein [Bacillus cereus]|uniref:Uncharacterized protein n=1 Tax=Bacillus cereus TIAC219 TaxID=718222 RepID=A0ABC9SQH2_BACCE|nr:hypothetical protein [Bacillus cereus]EJP81130.1 hypothetical protein IC1_06618 [Bacillus cereus VD022]EOQ57841.1 hypothetical protein IAY_06245 [Bacillus cereus TIAC219]
MKKEQLKHSIIALLQENDELLVSEITTKLNTRYHGGYAQYTNERVLDLLKEIQVESGVQGGSIELTAPTQEVATQTDVVFVPMPYDLFYKLKPWKRYTPKAIKRRTVRKLFY